MNIAVAGTGYVGMSIATLLAQHNHVIAVDVIPEKVEKINNKISPIQDDYIEKYLAEKNLDLTATLDGASAYKDADFVVIAAPTNYDPQKNFFDTHHIEDVIDLVLSVNPDAVMVIKSTIPVGYCRSLYVKYALKFLTDPELKGKKFNSRQSSCARARPFTTTSTPRVSLWAIPRSCLLTATRSGMRKMPPSQPLAILMPKPRPKPSQASFSKALSAPARMPSPHQTSAFRHQPSKKASHAF